MTCASCGKSRHLAGRGLCGACYSRMTCHGTLVDYPRMTRSRDELLEDYVMLRRQGHTWPQCAERLGMRYDAFARALQRARVARDPRAARLNEVDYNREKASCATG